MQHQVEILQEMLSRVQRNRERMAQDGYRRTRSAGASVANAPVMAEPEEAVEAEIPDTGSQIIDLVNPTSIPPAPIPLPQSVAPASVLPLSISPTAAAEPNDVRDALPPSLLPMEPRAGLKDNFSSDASSPVIPQARETRPEDDFSSVAPRSIIPPVEEDQTEDDFSSVAPPSIIPVADEDLEEEPVVDDEPAAVAMADSDEISSDVADAEPLPPSMMPVSAAMSVQADADTITETTSAANVEAGVDDVPLAAEPELERREYRATAAASAEVVSVVSSRPAQKSWTVASVLDRAWRLGSHD